MTFVSPFYCSMSPSFGSIKKEFFCVVNIFSYTAKDLRNGELQTIAFGSRDHSSLTEEEEDGGGKTSSR